MRRVVFGLLAVAGLGGAFAIAQSTGAPTVAPDPLQAAVAAGRHVRIDGPHGPIHVWIPAGYHADTGATIIYVHGFYDTADTAWDNHRLAEQFALTAANALFIAPEAPSKKGVPIYYPNLSELIQVVEDATGVERGTAYTAAFGHSGAIKTLYEWLDEPTLDAIGLVDALYLDEQPAIDWVKASPRRKLITVGEDTILPSENVADAVPNTVRLDRFPPTWALWPEEAKTAQSVYVRAQFTHMGLVTNAIVLPALIRLLPVELLADAPWQSELGSLVPIDAAPSKKK